MTAGSVHALHPAGLDDREGNSVLIGVLSDSHGDAETTARAVAALIAHGSEILLHLGDLCGDDVIDELVGHRSHIVFGNCDWNIEVSTQYAIGLGLQVDHPMGVIEADGRRIAFTHGDNAGLMQQALDAGVDYLLHGHTHTVSDQHVGSTRVLCPGALHRATRYTCALLDPARDRVRVLEIDS
jgi:putative phosphoesterase